jgi:phosphate transport system substrate-binding protein
LPTVARLFLVLGALFLFETSAIAQSRAQIRVVGSSTIFPFAKAVAEELGRSKRFRTPIIESTGSGGGLKLFCAGIGTNYPDITTASRRIKESELNQCARNGVRNITEVEIGYDGIVIAASKNRLQMTLTMKDIYLALAAKVPSPGTKGGIGKMVPNPYQTWQQVNPTLPDIEIIVLGPPPTSGTRDALNEIALEAGCLSFDGLKELQQSHDLKFQSMCRAIREDGAYIDAGENDNLIVQKLVANEKAVGIFGFSFLDQNTDILNAYAVMGKNNNSHRPTFDDIFDGSYPISRSLYLYVKNDHIGVIPGIREYLDEFRSDRASGEFGYLLDRGLVPLPTGTKGETVIDLEKTPENGRFLSEALND